MLMAHKLIDAAYGRDPKYAFRVKHGTSENIAKNLIRGVTEAEKFDFGELMLEKREEEGRARYRLPDLTIDEKQFWVEGFIPLPADVCWYEYSLGGKRIGLLVTEHHEDRDPIDYQWVVQRVDRQGTEFQFDGCLAAIKRRQQDPKSDIWQVARGGNKAIREAEDPEIQRSFMADVMLSIYLTLMINSKSTDVRTESAPDKLNKIRERKGETPLFSHRVVNIVPARFLRQAEREVQGTHASPRLHWRRSHRRSYDHQTANTRLMPDGRWGLVLPRCIVGRADIGVVSHEYRVQAPKDDDNT